MTSASNPDVGSRFSHQQHYAGVAAYLRASGLRESAALADILGEVNVRTAFWGMRYLPDPDKVSTGRMTPAQCTFPAAHVTLVRLRDLLGADLRSLQGLLGVAATAPHDRRRALFLHLQFLEKAHRLIADFADGTDHSTAKHEVESRARHIRSLLEQSDQPHRVARRAEPMATRPRQPLVNRRRQSHSGRPRMAG